MFPFTYATPEETGIKSACIEGLIKRLKKDNVPMHSLLLLHQNRLIFEGYYAPYEATTLHRMFSISKSFTAMAIGLLEAEGLLRLSDPICQYFKEYVTKDTHPWILAMTIEDMLMMRTCHASTTYKLNMQADWVESFFTTPPTHPSGKIFHYDTSSAHTLCALVEKLSGMDCLSYLKKKLAPLELSEASYMLKDPFGVSLGGSGLVALPMDLLKFGYLLSQEGRFGLEQLIPAAFVQKANSFLTPTKVTAPLPSEACGYGYQIWQNEKGGSVCYGMGGQFIILLPEYELICVTTADTQGMAGGNQLIYNALYEELLPFVQKEALPRDEVSYASLQKTAAQLSIAPLCGTTTSPCMENINQKTYALMPNTNGFEQITISFPDASNGLLQFTLRGKSYALPFGIGHLQSGIFPLYEKKCAASAQWLSEDTLYIRVHILDDYIGSVHFEFCFGDNDLTVFLKKVEESLFQEFQGHLYGTIS